jgi:hypothetical protein
MSEQIVSVTKVTSLCNSFLKDVRLAAFRITSGREFHASGMEYENARSPNLVRSLGKAHGMLWDEHSSDPVECCAVGITDSAKFAGH